MVNYSKSCPQNVMYLQWLYPPSTNYNQNALTDISIKHCEAVKMKKQQTLILTADIISTNIRIIRNLQEFYDKLEQFKNLKSIKGELKPKNFVYDNASDQ